MTRNVSPEDARCVAYFIREKGDVTRWSYWPFKGRQISAEVPELDDYLRARRVADALEEKALARLDEIAKED